MSLVAAGGPLRYRVVGPGPAIGEAIDGWDPPGDWTTAVDLSGGVGRAEVTQGLRAIAESRG